MLTDIGVEELGHLEMIGAMVHQLTRNLTEKQIEENPGWITPPVCIQPLPVAPLGTQRVSA